MTLSNVHPNMSDISVLLTKPNGEFHSEFEESLQEFLNLQLVVGLDNVDSFNCECKGVRNYGAREGLRNQAAQHWCVLLQARHR